MCSLSIKVCKPILLETKNKMSRICLFGILSLGPFTHCLLLRLSMFIMVMQLKDNLEHLKITEILNGPVTTLR